jgi:hypothetical protein
MSRTSGRQIRLEGHKNVIWSNNGGWSDERICIGNWDFRTRDSQVYCSPKNFEQGSYTTGL